MSCPQEVKSLHFQYKTAYEVALELGVSSEDAVKCILAYKEKKEKNAEKVKVEKPKAEKPIEPEKIPDEKETKASDAKDKPVKAKKVKKTELVVEP